MNFIDNFLNKITMYRLMLYYLILLLAAALIFSFYNFLPFPPASLIFSSLFIIGICWVTNKVFAMTFRVPTNVESAYISGLILSLIITPVKSLQELPFLFWVSVLAMASKYILALNKKHIFNPVAIALVLTYFTINGSASWWVGTSLMFPFILLGLLIVRKIRRWDLVFYFLLTALSTILVFSILNGNNIPTTLNTLFINSPLLFFAFVMLTEPLTTPPTKFLQSFYGALVGFLFSPQVHFGSFYTTPEIALVLGNIFSYFVSSKDKLILVLENKMQIGVDIIDFTFNLNKKTNFVPGQYLEWTLPHKEVDSRGNRRYFTIASSPTENNLRLGVKFYPNGSSFKKAMALMDNRAQIVASQLAGDFVLPRDQNQKLVFIAGGIGITPFRSMLKYLLDTNQKRPIVLMYSNKTASEVMYTDVLDLAFSKLGIKTVYTLTEKYPIGWIGKTGRVNAKMIAEEIPDWKNRMYYLSGPHGMVSGFKQVLKDMGINSKQIKIDFFPGYA